jgi:hypothetical protein
MAEQLAQTNQQVQPAELIDSMNKWDALKQQGWIKPVDYLFMFVIILLWTGMIVYYLTSFPSVYTLLSTGVCTVILLQIWLVMLVYRCMDFVLVTRADINLMPVSAARMAIAYFQAGQTPPTTK